MGDSGDEHRARADRQRDALASAQPGPPAGSCRGVVRDGDDVLAGASSDVHRVPPQPGGDLAVATDEVIGATVPANPLARSSRRVIGDCGVDVTSGGSGDVHHVPAWAYGERG